MSRSLLGTLLLIASATAYSTAGFFTRLIHVDAWTLLFWRGLFGGGFLAIVVALQQRGRIWPAIRAMGWEGVLVAICSAVATVCFLNAMRLTAVADVMVIDAAIPFVTAALAWLILGERESVWTLGATAVAFAGMAIMAGPSVMHGHFFGDALAFAMVVLMALVIVLIRAQEGRQHGAGGVRLGVPVFTDRLAVRLALAGRCRELRPVGAVRRQPVRHGLVAARLRYAAVSATRGALLGVLQTPLGTLWVWLAFAEQPALLTLIGGGIVLAAVVADMLAPHPTSTTSKELIRSGSPA